MTPALCECGCGAPAPIARKTDSRHGYVKGQPARFIRAHHVRLRERPLEDFYVVTDGCWLWTGKRDRGGYGLVCRQQQWRLAHRAVYEALIGPIPEGLELDHTCSNRSCVNPKHLEPVTRQENNRRMHTRRMEAR
jgi:hypothetical protein